MKLFKITLFAILGLGQVAAESWLTNLPGNLTVAGILGFFCWYFINQLNKQQEKHETQIKEKDIAHAVELTKVREEMRADRVDYQNRLDKLVEQNNVLAKYSVESISTSTNALNQILSLLKDVTKESK